MNRHAWEPARQKRSFRGLVPPAVTIDKRVYSPFSEPSLLRLLRQRRTESLVITGAETDICVLAAVLDAVDHGYRVILATDGLCSSPDQTHGALMTLYRARRSSRLGQEADVALKKKAGPLPCQRYLADYSCTGNRNPRAIA